MPLYAIRETIPAIVSFRMMDQLLNFVTREGSAPEILTWTYIFCGISEPDERFRIYI